MTSSPHTPSSEAHADDLALARAALAGRPTERARFVERMRCVPRFLAALNQRFGRRLSSEDLEDLVQETLVSIWRRLESYSGRASIQTWAFRFCHHAYLHEIAKRDRRPTALPLEERDEEHVTETPDSRHEIVYLALERLTDDEERVVRLRHFEHLDFHEIGLRIRISEGAAKARYYRAMHRLRDLMGSRAVEVEG